MSTVSFANEVEQESKTFEEANFSFEKDFTDWFTNNEKFLTSLIPAFAKPKKKLKGLFKGLKIEEEEIEEAKKSLFPEREF